MTFEKSNGKARPTHTRASDLKAFDTDGKPTERRAAHGHFAPGNRTAVAAGLKNTLRKNLGTGAEVGDQAQVTRDAARISVHVIRSLPDDSAPVRVLVAIHARHVALHGFYTARAEQVGLDTPEGLKLLEVADRQSARAERTLVSALDAARVCAESGKGRRGNVDPLAAYMRPLPARAAPDE